MRMRIQNLSWKGVTKGNCKETMWKGYCSTVRTLSWEMEASGSWTEWMPRLGRPVLTPVEKCPLALPQEAGQLPCIQVFLDLLASGWFCQWGPLAHMGGTGNIKLGVTLGSLSVRIPKVAAPLKSSCFPWLSPSTWQCPSGLHPWARTTLCGPATPCPHPW